MTRQYPKIGYGGIVVPIVAIAAMFLLYTKVIGEREVASSLLAMVSTFVGALFAFRLNENKELKKADKERKASLNKALLILVRQINAIGNLSKQLAPYKDDFDRAFNLPAFQPPAYSDLVHDFHELAFLLENGFADLILRISVEQEGFHQTIESLRVRNDIYVNEVQKTISSLSLSGKTVANIELEEVMGQRLFQGAVRGAKIVFEHVEASEKSLAALHADLFKAAKTVFPDEKFLQYSARS